MTGAEHFRTAEKLIEVWEGSRVGDQAGVEALAAAQAHATLALAAATAVQADRRPS